MQINAPALRQILTTYFNDGELRDLCFDLSIDYESLPGQGKADKARELVAYAQRHERSAELVALGRCLRPNADWQAVAQATLPEQRPVAPPTPPQQPPAEQLTAGRRRRLQQQLDGLLQDLDLRRAKWKSLRAALSIEAGVAVKFQLEQQIRQEEQEIAQLETEIEDIERVLG